MTSSCCLCITTSRKTATSPCGNLTICDMCWTQYSNKFGQVNWTLVKESLERIQNRIAEIEKERRANDMSFTDACREYGIDMTISYNAFTWEAAHQGKYKEFSCMQVSLFGLTNVQKIKAILREFQYA
jgi:hypothetical protein